MGSIQSVISKKQEKATDRGESSSLTTTVQHTRPELGPDKAIVKKINKDDDPQKSNPTAVESHLTTRHDDGRITRYSAYLAEEDQSDKSATAVQRLAAEQHRPTYLCTEEEDVEEDDVGEERGNDESLPADTVLITKN